jgi:hypothetical protein
MTGLGVVGWFLGGQKPKKVPRLVNFFCEIFFRVFELPSPRNTQKREKTKSRKKWVLDFLSIFLQKLFDTIFFVKRFLLCFWTPIAK